MALLPELPELAGRRPRGCGSAAELRDRRLRRVGVASSRRLRRVRRVQGLARPRRVRVLLTAFSTKASCEIHAQARPVRRKALWAEQESPGLVRGLLREPLAVWVPR